MEPDRVPRPAGLAIVASAVTVGGLLGAAYVLVERIVRDELVGALVVPGVLATLLAIASLFALGDRGGPKTPLVMLAAWAVVAPPVAGITTALVALAIERAEYVPHAAVQSAVRAEVAVVVAGLVLAWAWLRRRRRRPTSE